MFYLSVLLGPAGPARADGEGSPPDMAVSEGLHWTLFLLGDGGGEDGGVEVVTDFLFLP